MRVARKVFVEVIAKHDVDGRIIPEEIHWEDGHTYEIDKILDVAQRASLKVGGMGLRYTCVICGQEKYIFLDEGRWFVEGK